MLHNSIRRMPEGVPLGLALKVKGRNVSDASGEYHVQ